MQHYSALFEASIDGVPASQAKSRNLSFEVAGDGNLPRISILKPTTRNKKGQPLLLFKKNLVNRKESLPLVITNEGTLNSKVYIDMNDTDSVFKLVPTGECRAFITEDYNQNGKPFSLNYLFNEKQLRTIVCLTIIICRWY